MATFERYFGDVRALVQAPFDIHDGGEELVRLFMAMALVLPEHQWEAMAHYVGQCWTVERAQSPAQRAVFATVSYLLKHWPAVEVAVPQDVSTCVEAWRRHFIVRTFFEPIWFEYKVRLVFARYGSVEMMRSVVMPPQLMAYYAATNGASWTLEPRRWHSSKIFSADHLMTTTAYDCKMWQHKRPEHADAWLTVGDWSERHLYCMCCTPGPKFGQVYDFHDDHPWHKGTGDLEGASLVAFLDGFRATSFNML